MEVDPTVLLGPLGFLMGAIVAVGVLWKAHSASDADMRVQRDKALEGWRVSVDNVGRLADAMEADARDRAARQRRNP